MHKVERKETIFSISRQYGISEEELIAANPELKKGKLKRGSFLFIPYPASKQPAKEPEKLRHAYRQMKSCLPRTSSRSRKYKT